MILMNSVLDLVTPCSCTTDLIGASVSLDYQQVSGLKPESIDLPIEQLNFVNHRKVE